MILCFMKTAAYQGRISTFWVDFSKHSLIRDTSVSGQTRCQKRFLIRVINNICYVRYKVEKLHRIHIAFYDGPLLDATQYYQNLKLCQGPFLFIDGKKSVLHPGNYDLMIYSLNFSRLARTWPAWDWAIHLNVNAQVRRKKPGLNSLYPH